MNKVILTGNLCKDIDIRYNQNDQALIKNTIAVKNNYKNTDGEYESQFINFVVWNNNAEYLKKYAEKGSKVLIEGRINNGNYEKEDGQKAYVTEIIAERIEILDFKKDNQKTSKAEKKEKLDDDVFRQFGESIEVSDADLPF